METPKQSRRPRQPRRPRQHTKFKTQVSSDNTYVSLIYLGTIGFIFTLVYIFLVVSNRDIPPFIPGTIGLTLGPLIYTIKPKMFG